MRPAPGMGLVCHTQGWSRTQQSAYYVIWSEAALANLESSGLFTLHKPTYIQVVYGVIYLLFPGVPTLQVQVGRSEQQHEQSPCLKAPVTGCLPMRKWQDLVLILHRRPSPPQKPSFKTRFICESGVSQEGCSRPAPHNRESPIRVQSCGWVIPATPCESAPQRGEQSSTPYPRACSNGQVS